MMAAGRQRPRQGLLKRLGMAGFAFFLVKGLLWLSLPLLIGKLSL